MWQSFTRAQMRDAVRRQVRVLPPIDIPDFPGAVEGMQPPNQRNPTNEVLNQLINKVCSKIGRKARNGVSTSPISYAVAAQTVNGPMAIPLNGWQGTSEWQINKLSHVWFVPSGSTNSNALKWSNRFEQDAFNLYYQDYAPSTPYECWISGYTLNVSPAPSVAGTLYATAELGVNAPVSDTDTLGQLPADYYPVLIDNVVLELCAIQPDDAVFAAQAQASGAMAVDGMGDLIGWINDQNGTNTSSLRVRSTRLYPTYRRG